MENRTAKDIADKYLNTPKTETPVPVDIQYDENLHPFFEGQAVTSAAPKYQPSPTFFEAAGQSFFRNNDFTLQYKHLSEEENQNNPLFDPVPENWKVSDDESNFAGVQQRYYGYIMDASGPKDAKRRYYHVLDLQEADDYYNRGSALAHFVGGIPAALLSPTSFIPMAATVKYARLSTTMLENIPKVIKGVAASSVAHEAWVETNKVGGNLEDFALNAFTDTIIGTAFIGAGLGLGHGFDGLKFWNAREQVKLNYEGVDVKPFVNQDGVIEKYVASSNTLSAARVSEAEAFVNSTMAQSGLFAIPKIGGWLGKGAGKVNPIIRGLNSRFSVMRGFVDRVADHGIVTEGNIAGNASPDKFEIMMANLSGDNTAMYLQLKGLHLERNGIEPGNAASNLLAKTKAKWKGDGYTDESKFANEIVDVLINETPSKHGAVNEAANMLRAKMDESYKAFREAYGLPESWLPPKTSRGYLSRVYDVAQMNQRPDEWESMWVEWLKHADGLINSYMKPIRDLEKQIKLDETVHQNYIRTPNLTSAQIKTSADKLLNQQKKLKQMKNKVQDEMRSNEDLRMHLDDFGALSAKEASQLRKLKKPLREMNKKLKAAREALAKHKFEMMKAKSSASKAKTKETASKYMVEYDKLEKGLSKLEDDARALRDLRDKETDRLQELVQDGKVDPILYEKIPDSQLVKFKKTSDRLKFRETFESEFHMRQAAKANHETITNQTAEDTINQIMGSMLGRHGENPLKERTLMIPDEILYKNNFLSKNLGVNVMNYRNVLGRKTFLKNVFKDVTLDGGIKPIVLELDNQARGMRNAITEKIKAVKASKKPEKEKNAEIAKLEKEARDLNKDFDNTKEDMNLWYNKMMGRVSGSAKMRQFANVTRSFAAAVRLGAVPLTMSTDMMAIAYKHGLWPMIRDGLMPMLANAGNLVKGGKGNAYSENAGHANLAMNHVLSGYSDRNWAGRSQPYEPVGNKLVNGMEKMGQLSGNLAGTNYIENFLQRWTASVVQSKVIRYMLDYKAGTLSAKNKEKLLVYGLDPEKWADKFIKGWESRGKDGNGIGGYQSRYWEWADLESANKMAETIQRGTRDTIIRRGMFDAPFAMDDPMFSIIFSFKGWVMASLTRYLTPLMQRPDAEKLIGTMLMLTAGATVTPLRRLAKGEDPIQEDDNMFWNAMVDGGVFSSITDTLEYANVLMGGNLLKDVKNDRYAERTIAGALAGPVGGMADDMVHILKMMSSGNFNQNDVNKMARLIPFTQSWHTRYLSNKMVESFGLPKTYNEASRQ